MTNRFPLIVDNSTGTLKELPAGDSLDLTGCDITNASALDVNGQANVQKITIGTQTIDPGGTPGSTNNAPLATVAFTGNYNDLSDLPNSGFSGSYNDLSDTPVVPQNIRDLDEVSTSTPDNNQALIWNDFANQYEPKDIILDLDLSSKSIKDLFDVSYFGSPSIKQVLKYSAGAWRPGSVDWSEITNKPDLASKDDLKLIDGDFQGSVFADDSTLLVDGVNAEIPGYVSISTLKGIIAASTDFADFQTRIANEL
jgi:hypothetical protein